MSEPTDVGREEWEHESPLSCINQEGELGRNNYDSQPSNAAPLHSEFVSMSADSCSLFLNRSGTNGSVKQSMSED